MRSVPGRYVVLTILGVSAIVVGIAAVMLFGHPRGKIAPPPSVAVLRVEGDADGAVTHEIIEALKPVEGLQVADAGAFNKRDIRAIGQKLNVRTVLVGSMENSRVTLKLLNAADEFELWTRAYDRNASFRESLARDISGPLGLK